jgi:hypothetical protein
MWMFVCMRVHVDVDVDVDVGVDVSAHVRVHVHVHVHVHAHGQRKPIDESLTSIETPRFSSLGFQHLSTSPRRAVK